MIGHYFEDRISCFECLLVLLGVIGLLKVSGEKAARGRGTDHKSNLKGRRAQSTRQRVASWEEEGEEEVPRWTSQHFASSAGEQQPCDRELAWL